MTDPRALTMTHQVSAAPEQVFRAWADPVQLAKWWGPEGARSVFSNDFEPGGQWRAVMQFEGVEYPTHGTYTEIVVPKRLCFTLDTTEHPRAWQDQLNALRKKQHLGFKCRLEADFRAVDGGTEIAVALRFDDEDDVAAVKQLGAAQAWAQSFARLTHCLSSAR